MNVVGVGSLELVVVGLVAAVVFAPALLDRLGGALRNAMGRKR
jgi:Sec-independent protein translocase protein TatA